MSAFTRVSHPDSAAAVLIFDGDCGFCTTAVEWMKRSLPVMPEAVPYQWADLDSYGLSLADAQSRVWLVTSTRQFSGAGAVGAILRQQPIGSLRFLGWLAVAPLWSTLADVAYALVAKYRYRLPGGTPACRVPSGSGASSGSSGSGAS